MAEIYYKCEHWNICRSAGYDLRSVIEQSDMNQIDCILKSKKAIQRELIELDACAQMSTRTRTAALVDCAIDSLHDAIETLERAVDESLRLLDELLS